MSDAPTSTLKQAEHPPALGIDPVVVLHKGVVLGSLAGYERVLHGWSPTERRAIAVKCDAQGEPYHDRLAHPITQVPACFGEGDPKARLGSARRIVISENPAILEGIHTDDPGLLVVPAGPCEGRMLGELTAEELERLRAEKSTPGALRAAIGEVRPASLPRREHLEAPTASPPQPTAPAGEEVRRALNREGRLERMKLVTREINSIPLTRIMEEMYGYAGEKSGSRHLKYAIDAGVLMNVEKDGRQFGALNGHTFSCLEGKRGGAGAINLVRAIEEARGSRLEFAEARRRLHVQFAGVLPPLEDAGFKAPRLQLKVGEVNPAIWFHKGAVIQQVGKDGEPKGNPHLVVEPWSPDTKQVTLVEVDAAGQRICKDGKLAEPLALAFATSPRTAAALVGDADHAVMVKSQHNQIRPGTRSDDPGLILAPYGPCAGMMLGQLPEAQLQNLAASCTSPRLREAVLSTVPQRFAPGVNPPERKAAQLVGEELAHALPSAARRISVPLERSSVPANSPYILAREGESAVLNNEQITRDYLIERRKLPGALVDAALKSGAAYPSQSVVYKQDRVTGEPTSEVLFHNPAICIPILGLNTGKVIAHQLKTVHVDPAIAKRQKGKDSHNFGPVQQGFAVIGAFDPNITKEVVVTEAWIDGMSYWALKQPEPSTCVMATTGTRTPEALIALCGEKGISVTRALDNDFAGRDMSRRIGEACAAAGVSTREEFVEPSEYQLALKDNPTGCKRLEETRKFCVENKIMVLEQPTRGGWIRVVVDNTAESSEFMEQVRKEDRLERQKEGREEKYVTVEVMNKDWNDLIKGDYHRTFTRDFEREFHDRAPEEAAAEVAMKKAIEVDVAGGPDPSQRVAVMIDQGKHVAPSADDSAVKGVGPLTIAEDKKQGLGVTLLAGAANVDGTDASTSTAAASPGGAVPRPEQVPEMERTRVTGAPQDLKRILDEGFEREALTPNPIDPNAAKTGGTGWTPSEDGDSADEG